MLSEEMLWRMIKLTLFDKKPQVTQNANKTRYELFLSIYKDLSKNICLCR